MGNIRPKPPNSIWGKQLPRRRKTLKEWWEKTPRWEEISRGTRLTANLGRNVSKLIGRNFIMQQENDPEHTADRTKDFIREKKWKVLDWPSQSPDLNTKPRPPENQTTTERGCCISLEKHHKGRMQQFGDVSGSQAWCSYCKQGICYQIFHVICFHVLKYSLFQYFCSPENGKNGSDTKGANVLSSLV